MPRPTTKCTPSGSAATQSAMLPRAVRSSTPSSVHSSRSCRSAPLTKRAPPGSTATAKTVDCARLDGALARAVAPHLEPPPRPTPGDDAAVGRAARSHAPVVPGERHHRRQMRSDQPALRNSQTLRSGALGRRRHPQRCRGRAAAGRARGPGRPPQHLGGTAARAPRARAARVVGIAGAAPAGARSPLDRRRRRGRTLARFEAASTALAPLRRRAALNSPRATPQLATPRLRALAPPTSCAAAARLAAAAARCSSRAARRGAASRGPRRGVARRSSPTALATQQPRVRRARGAARCARDVQQRQRCSPRRAPATSRRAARRRAADACGRSRGRRRRRRGAATLRCHRMPHRSTSATFEADEAVAGAEAPGGREHAAHALPDDETPQPPPSRRSVGGISAAVCRVLLPLCRGARAAASGGGAGGRRRPRRR